MIAIKLQGRLGNQMFQYAFAEYVSSKFSVSFFFDATTYSFLLPRYFKVKKLPTLLTGIYSNKLFRYGRKLVNRHFIRNRAVQVGKNDPQELLRTLSNWTRYEIYCQSYDCFRSVENSIRNTFQIKKEYVRQFKGKYQTLFEKSKTIVAHFRGGDYFDWGDDNLGGKNPTLPLSFYANCFNKIENIGQYQIIFVSDSISYVKRYFGENNNCQYESNSEIVDFQILLNADIVIASNSSFAWWGAFLNLKRV